MYLDHPKLTATNSESEPDRLERLNRVYGYAIALADVAGDAACIGRLAQIHDHKGTLIVVWNVAPTEQQKGYFVTAWLSLLGDGTTSVEHEVKSRIPAN
jgi:hypothetical protein